MRDAVERIASRDLSFVTRCIADHTQHGEHSTVLASLNVVVPAFLPPSFGL